MTEWEKVQSGFIYKACFIYKDFCEGYSVGRGSRRKSVQGYQAHYGVR